LDPIAAAQLAKAIGPVKVAKSTAHRSPKVAKRVSVGGGPEGRGHVERGPDGQVVAVVLELDLLPVPKERARVVRTKTGKTVSYTPARTKRFTADVQAVVEAVMVGAPPIEGPVSLTMTFAMDIPSSWAKWRKEAAREGRMVPTSRPDMDNLEKALLDALNGRAFTDDAFVVDRLARKRFSLQPGIQVEVRALPYMAQTDPRPLSGVESDEEVE
jgi:Holliday junction resolvase RusA-like endonuclease